MNQELKALLVPVAHVDLQEELVHQDLQAHQVNTFRVNPCCMYYLSLCNM